MNALLLTPTGERLARVELPEGRPRDQPFVLCWGELVFAFVTHPVGGEPVYVQVQKVTVSTVFEGRLG
jgi:hypothetical protein